MRALAGYVAGGSCVDIAPDSRAVLRGYAAQLPDKFLAVPKARESILDAASSHGIEDRLTEVFASVLAIHSELASAFFAVVGLPDGDRFRVRTQEQVAPGSRPDMLVEALSRNGAVVSRVWSEHKLQAGFQDMQRERYAEVLSTVEGPGKLVLIVRDAPTAREHGDWRGFTWQEIGELIDRVGRDWGGSNWRRLSLEPGAPAKQRLLTELIWYLEDKELAVVNSLNADNLLAYKLTTETAHALQALLERAAQNAAPLIPDGGGDEHYATFWEQFEIPSGSWLERFTDAQVSIELLASDRDYWSPERRDEPAFGAGFSFEAALHPSLSAHADWVARLDAAGFSCELWAHWVRVYKTMPMSDLLDAGTSLESQAESLGDWTRSAITDLNALDPEGSNSVGFVRSRLPPPT